MTIAFVFFASVASGKKFWPKDVDPGDTGEHYSILKISESLQDERVGD